MEIKKFINENYVYIKSIATNEYNKDKNKMLYRQFGCDDFVSEVMMFFIKNYNEYDETKCSPRSFIIKNCLYCSGALRNRLTKSNRCIDFYTSNESDLLQVDDNDDILNVYENVGEEDFYVNLNIFHNLTEEEKTLCLYKLYGLSMNEMENLTGKSRQTLWRKFKNIENKLI